MDPDRPSADHPPVIRAFNIGGVLLQLCARPPLNVAPDHNCDHHFSAASTPSDKPAARLLAEIRTGAWPDISTATELFNCGEGWILLAQDKRRYALWQPPNHSEPVWCAEFVPGTNQALIHCGKALLAPSTPHSSSTVRNPLRYPLDMILMMYTLAEIQGLILHAAGAIVNNRAVVLPGQSGAGKSTIAALLRNANHLVLSDDRIILYASSTTPTAWGTPWLGQAEFAANATAPLAALIFMQQADHNSLHSIPTRQALACLLQSCSIPWPDTQTADRILATCDRLLSTVPCFLLSFKPESHAIRLIEQATRSALPT